MRDGRERFSTVFLPSFWIHEFNSSLFFYSFLLLHYLVAFPDGFLPASPAPLLAFSTSSPITSPSFLDFLVAGPVNSTVMLISCHKYSLRIFWKAYGCILFIQSPLDDRSKSRLTSHTLSGETFFPPNERAKLVLPRWELHQLG